MDKLQELRKKQEELAKLNQDIEALQKDKQVQKELEFQKELDALLKRYGKTRDDLAPGGPRASGGGKQRRRRRLKTYVNPHTGERVQTRGGNHKVLKAWKAEYGADEVEKWVQ